VPLAPHVSTCRRFERHSSHALSTCRRCSAATAVE
jgi:hypothetical protein